MRNRVPDEAICPICGRHFDPSETRGWCPNPACGEWQHPAVQVDGEAEPAESAPEPEPDHPDDEPTISCPECGEDVRADARFCKYCSHPLDEEPAPTPDQGSPGDSTDELTCPDCDFVLSDIPRDQLSVCPICRYDVTPLLEDDDAATEPDREELAVCPNCGEDLSEIPSDLRTVCPGCRIDLEARDDAESEPGESSVSDPPVSEDGPGREEEDHDPEPVPIEAVEAIDPGYGPRLEEADVSTLGELLQADPRELSTKTGISARRIRSWIEDARIDREKPTQETTESNDEAGSPELVFEVMGREISVVDGQTVGGEIRSAMVEGGASEADAVYVHRKHVRIDAENGAFFLTRLGENALEVNGRAVEKGGRIPIEDGDEVTFSDVVDVTVSIR